MWILLIVVGVVLVVGLLAALLFFLFVIRCVGESAESGQTQKYRLHSEAAGAWPNPNNPIQAHK